MAGQQVGSLFVKLGADVSGLDAGLKHAQALLKNTAASLSSLGNKLTLGITLPVAAAGGAMLKMAADAVESENLFNVSMGSMADEARAWSEGLRDALGVSAYETRKSLGTFNAMFTGMGLGKQAALSMGEGLTQLSYDLASFYNLSTDDALQKLRSGIVGEIEPLRALGVVVDDNTVKAYAVAQGWAKQGQELSEQQKVLARYGVIMQQTSQAQGDMARTMDSPVNQMRRFQQQVNDAGVELGQVFLPIASEALGWLVNTGMPAVKVGIDEFKGWWTELSDRAKTEMLVVGGLFLGSGPLLKGLAVGIQGIGLLVRAIKLLPLEANLAVAAAGTILGTFYGVSKKVAGMSYEEYASGQNYDYGLPMTREEYEKMQAAAKGAARGIEDTTAAAIKAVGAGAIDLLADQVQNLGAGFKGMFERAPQEEGAIAGALKYQKSLHGATLAQANLKAEAAKFAAAGTGAGKVKADVDELKQSLDAAGISQKEFVDYLVQQTPAAMAAAAAVDALKLRLTGLKDQQAALQASSQAAQDALQGMQERVSALSDQLSEAKARLSDLGRVRLPGMQALDDQLFAIDQQIKRLQLTKLLGGPAGELDKQIEALQHQRDILQLQGEVQFEPGMRQIQQALAGKPLEMPLGDALKAIADTQGQIRGLEGALAGAQQAVKDQEKYIRSLELAQRDINTQIQLTQDQLTGAESKQKLVTDALTTAYNWYLADKDAIAKLGGEAVTQAGIVDKSTQELLRVTSKFAVDQSNAAIAAIRSALDEYNRARADMAKGLYPGALPVVPETPQVGAGVVGKPLTDADWSNPGAVGSVTNNVTVNVAGNVTSERDLVQAVRAGLIRTGRANGGAGIP